MKQLWRQQIFVISVLVFTAVGCATRVVREGPYQKAQWETKALIKDLKQSKNQSVNIDIYAIKGERVRLEVTALLGFQVASLVMSPQEIAYAIYPQKRFYYGRNSERAVERMIGVSLHPMNLASIAFDEPVRGPGWACALDSQGWVAQCENRERQISVKWLDRNEGKKKVLVAGPQFEMQWHFDAPQTEVQFKPELFTLQQPQGFKAIQIN